MTYICLDQRYIANNSLRNLIPKKCHGIDRTLDSYNRICALTIKYTTTKNYIFELM